jgi:hypothetical protein
MARQKRVLFVTYGGGHVNALLPVIRALRARRPDVEVTVLGLTTAAAVLHEAGIPCLGFKDVMSAADVQALEHGQRLASSVPGGQVSVEESVAYLGLSYADLVTQHGEAGARSVFEQKGRLAFIPLTALERVFDRVRPDLVVATNSPRAERAAILVARRRGVPAICVGDLWLGFELEWIAAPDYADRVLVLNEFVRQKVIAAGRDPAAVVVTGNPAFDRLAEPQWHERGAQIRAEIGSGNRQVVLWMSHAMPWAPQIRARIARTLVEAAASHPEWHVVLRAHPSEPPLDFELPHYVGVSDPRVQPAPAALRACDVGVTMMSTMGLEAVMLGIPMVTTAIVPEQRPTYIDLDYENFLRNMQLAEVADDFDRIVPAIERALRDRPDHRHRLPPVGGATDAVMAQIVGFLDA